MIPATIAEDVVRYRREFHRWPELGFQEFKTAERLLEILREIPGLELQTQVAETGIVALLRGGQPGRTLLVRADMDGLPIQEIHACEYKSENPGVMHACGHDAHMAMQLGAIKLLAAKRAQLRGNVKFIFQPAEEGPGGAKPMIDAGVMENPKVDNAIGYHIWNSLPVGQIGVVEGPCMANTDVFEIEIQGRGGHGAMPHLSVDSIVVAAHVVTALQSVVARNVNPLERAVVTVGTLEAGDRHNIIAHTAKLTGTCRSFTPEVGKLIPERIQQIAEHTCAAFGAKCHLNYSNVYPATCNDAAVSKDVVASAAKVVGPENVVAAQPSMGGEDMSYFLEAVPGCYFFIGSANKAKGIDVPHHHPAFTIDEDSLAIGTAVIVQVVEDYLAQAG